MAELELVDPEELRRPDTQGSTDLRAWRFRAKYWNDDTTTVLAWADDRYCVFHEQTCNHISQTEAPTALCRVDSVRELFAKEQPKGTGSYFDFCGTASSSRSPTTDGSPPSATSRRGGT